MEMPDCTKPIAVIFHGGRLRWPQWDHLSLPIAYSEKNKTNFHNLCVCFQPALKIKRGEVVPHIIHRYHEARIYIIPDLQDWHAIEAKYRRSVAHGAPSNHPALEYWGRKSNEQTLRGRAYTDLVNEFNRLEAAGVDTEAEKKALREQFEMAVLMLEFWVVKNKELFWWVQKI